MLEALQLNAQSACETIANFIQTSIEAAHLDGAVIALSGGIDSAAAIYLTERAIGADRIHAFNMPYNTSNPASQAHAQLCTDDLGIAFDVIEITPMIDTYFDRFPDADRLRRANKMARERMSIIYDMANIHNAMVIGTGNRTEGLLGYTTMWGDMAAGIAPIGHLYKAQVRQLSAYIGVPQPILDKAPSADLWDGQTDEGELGLTYEMADWILYNLFDLEKTPDEVIGEGVDIATVQKVITRVERNAFKRCMPPICDISGCWPCD